MNKKIYVRTYLDDKFMYEHTFYYDFLAEDFAARMRRNTRLTTKYNKIEVLVIKYEEVE